MSTILSIIGTSATVLVALFTGVICWLTYKQSKVRLQVIANFEISPLPPRNRCCLVNIYNKGNRKAEVFRVEWQIGKHVFFIPFEPDSVPLPREIEAAGYEQFSFRVAGKAPETLFWEEARKLAKYDWQRVRNIKRIKVVVHVQGCPPREFRISKQMIGELMLMHKHDKSVAAAK